ncbi:phospholipid hydroperoxide glutathione peroxidase-like [Agrilus planipennis]|uniref:Glutathione peroxidase n=1 Tax=Agrilus planipennis TaxID=224129 RepID=A0A1W4WXJ5_AGRPL|nr:phospholipid hydroperoxide glutathione peroxidase-like [Agrilus planipennis]
MDNWEEAETIYEFTAKDLKTGEEVSLKKYKGHVCIIVNVASKCGYTKRNYEQLVKLHEKYGEEKGLKILAFPCNQFGKQEPGNSEKICEFAEKKNVKFDMFEKINVNGKDAHPLWKFLQNKIPGERGKAIKWNFTKFIINEDGEPVERFASAKNPNDLVEVLEKYW